MFATTLYKMHFCAIIPLQRNTHTRSLMDRTMPSDGINVGSTPAECTKKQKGTIEKSFPFYMSKLLAIIIKLLQQHIVILFDFWK